MGGCGAVQRFLGETSGLAAIERQSLVPGSNSSSISLLRDPGEGLQARGRGWTEAVVFPVTGVCHHSCHGDGENQPESCPEVKNIVPVICYLL